MIKRSAFNPVANPRLARAPPSGADWLHEIKFDGFRLQAHKLGAEVRLFSKAGRDFTDRFPLIPAAVLRLEANSAVIDGELVSCDDADQPDFYALLRRQTKDLCVWCFDLLTLNERDLRPLPLEQRKAMLSALLTKTDEPRLRLSHTLPTARNCCMRRRNEALRASLVRSARNLTLQVPDADG